MTSPPRRPLTLPPLELPPLEELLTGLRVVAIPMRVRFRGVTVREAALFRGPSGWAEFSPFVEYGPVESSRWLLAAVEAGWGQWPAPCRELVPVNATVPAVSAADVPGVLARFDGATTAKVKVAERGQTIEDDVDRVAAVRDAMGAGGRIRVDANGGWSVREATDALGRLAAYGLEYAEQPCAEVDELRELRVALARSGTDVLVAADESIRKAEDPLHVAREEAADLVVVKVAPLGGVARALEVVEECGLPAVVSSALDTSVGMAAGVALAAALPDLPFACGLATVALLEGDVTEASLLPRGGALSVGRVEADEALLTRWAAPRGRVDWWTERVRDCWSVLA